MPLPKKTKNILFISGFIGVVVLLTITGFWLHPLNRFPGLGNVFLQRQGAEGPYSDPIFYQRHNRPPLSETRQMPGHILNFSTALSDNGYLRLTLNVKFDTDEGAKAFKARSDRINYALQLSLRNHASDIFIDGENRVYNTAAEILRTQLPTPPRYIYITRFDVRPPSNAG